MLNVSDLSPMPPRLTFAFGAVAGWALAWVSFALLGITLL